MMPSVAEMEAYIRQAALTRGIDPDVAVRVAKTEGLGDGIWQSNVTLDYGRERSYGPFQLHVAPAGRSPGLGNAFMEQTGLDPSDPSTWRQGVDFALENAAKGGWSPWMGAAKAGITGMDGIGVRDDRGGSYNSGYGSSAPSMQTPGLLDASIDVNSLSKMGLKALQNDQADDQENEEDRISAVVLQPLRRIQLGKGLLG